MLHDINRSMSATRNESWFRGLLQQIRVYCQAKFNVADGGDGRAKGRVVDSDRFSIEIGTH